MHGMHCMCSYQTCVCVHLLSLASIAIAAMAFRSEPVKVKEVFMISGGCQSKTAEIFCIAKDELLILNDKTYFEIAASGKYRYKFASLFGQRELQVVLDDLRIKRRAATLKLSKDAGGGHLRGDHRTAGEQPPRPPAGQTVQGPHVSGPGRIGGRFEIAGNGQFTSCQHDRRCRAWSAGQHGCRDDRGKFDMARSSLHPCPQDRTHQHSGVE